MAAKIKEGLRDIKQGVLEKLTGPKYADNLLGESLQDQLRKATAKELVEPSEELNSQVVDTINQDIANGKDSKEIISLLKKRLRTDNPHKQWLAVQLVGRVLRDCSAGVGLYTEDVLQEVARVMARPAKADSDAGRLTRQAAKELLRSFGRAGTSAFRAASRSAVEGARTNSRNALGAHGAAGGASAANTEAASLVAEVQMLVEQATANTELLSEMLITQDTAAAGAGPAGAAAAAGGGKDEFEGELTRELVAEVRELRGLFDAYLEQLQALMSSGQGGPDVEAALMRALEAGDMLDGALALAKDVSSNQRELEQQALAGGGAVAGGGAAAANPAAAAAAAVDLISLDDFAMPAPPPVLATGAPAPQDPFAALATGTAAPAAAAAPHDPFAASNNTPVMAVGSPPAAAAAAPAPSYQPYPGAPAPAPAAYPPYGQPPAPYGAQPPAPYGQPPAAAAQSYPGAPPPYGQPPAPPAAASPNNPFAGAVPTYGSAAAPPAVAAAGSGGVSAAPSNNPFSAAPSVASGGGAPPATAGPTGGSGTSSVDAEWAMFFAGRTGAAGAPQQQSAGGAH